MRDDPLSFAITVTVKANTYRDKLIKEFLGNEVPSMASLNGKVHNSIIA